jgi:hypothetical protein
MNPMLEPRQQSHIIAPSRRALKVQSRYQMIDFPEEIYRNAMESTAKYTRGSWIKVPFNHFCNDGDGDVMILDALDCHFSAATPELQLQHGRSTGGVSGLRKNCLGFRASASPLMPCIKFCIESV